MHDKELVESICRNYHLSEQVVTQYRQIHSEEAIERFLSPESKARLEKKGYDPSDSQRSMARRLGHALIHFQLPEFKTEFYQTQEGTLWYELNVAVPCAMAGQMCNSLDEQIFNGQPEQYSPAQKVAFEIHLNIQRGAQNFALSIRRGQAATRAKLRGRRFRG